MLQVALAIGTAPSFKYLQCRDQTSIFLTYMHITLFHTDTTALLHLLISNIASQRK